MKGAAQATIRVRLISGRMNLHLVHTMNDLPFNKRPINTQIYGASSNGPIALRTDDQGRPVLRLDATQTIAASSLDIRDLSAADIAAITAAGFAIRSLDGSRDSVTTVENPFTVLSATATLVLGGTSVLTVDTSPYSNSAFLVRADAISLLTTVSLQLAPVTTASYFTTIASESGLILGGRYLLLPPMSMRYARIFATGIGSVLTAYYIGQV